MRQNLTVKELPDSERPYEKFRRGGAEALSDAELLAIIIRTGTNGKKSIEVAQDFLNLGEKNLLNLYSVSFQADRHDKASGARMSESSAHHCGVLYGAHAPCGLGISVADDV